MVDFRMPSLGADMEAGTLVQWVKQPGDALRRGDIIAVVDTQKGAIEIEVFEDGVLAETVVNPGTEVPVGTVLARIRTTAEASAIRTPTEPTRPSVSASMGPEPAPATATVGAGHATQRSRVAASPAARALATELGVDLATVVGTGPDGAVTLDDVRGVVPAAPGARPSTSERTPGMRAAIGAAMARAKREIPHYYLSTTIDMTAALDWMRTVNVQRPVTGRLIPAVLLLKAVALALRDVPELNGHWVEGRFRPGDGVHLGVAISLRGGGLVAPAIHRADELSLDALMHALQDLVVRAREGSLRSSELVDATITVTNLGDQGVDATFGIIYPPQVAIVGFGTIAKRPWVGPSGSVDARELVVATLSADHRASDGHRGGQLLAAVSRRLQEPERI